MRTVDPLRVGVTPGGESFMSLKSKLNRAACSFLVAAAATGGALAQEPVQPADAAGEQEGSDVDRLMDAVTITARRKEESLQSAPVSVSAFSGESLEIRGIYDIGEIESITPNLTYQNSPGAGGASQVATVYIRGVGQRDFLGTIDNGVGFYIDDVYISRTVGALVDLLDVDRVEVLRGPQGTLFGRNNVGGAVQLHSKAPSDEFSGYVDAMYGTDNLYSVKGKVNIPFSDTFLTSASILLKGQDGYVSHSGGDLGDVGIVAGRFSALWTPTADLEFDFSYDISDSDDNGPAFTLLSAGATVSGGFAGFYNNVLNGATCAYPGGITSTDPSCYNDQYVSENSSAGTAPAFSKIIHQGARLGIDWDISADLQFESITAYRDLDSKFARDADHSPIEVVHFFDDFETQSFSQEFKLSGDTLNERFDWILGAYYFEEEGFNLNRLNFAIASFDSANDFSTESVAAFAQGTYDLTNRFHVTAGIRWTEEEKTFDPVQTVGVNNIGIPVGVPILPLGEVSRKDDAVTPLFNVAYDIAENFMVYATYSEGFRSGGFVQRIFPPLPVVPSFGPETAESVELGFKYQRGGFTLNGAAFQVDYTDIQVRTQNPGFVGFFEDNVGNAEISGFELETKFSPAQDWFMEATLGHTNAEYTLISVEPPLVAIIDTDSEFDHVPEWSASASVLRDFDLGSAGELTARLSVDYHDGYFNDPENSPLIVTPERTITDFTFVWSTPNPNLAVDFGVRNLTDEIYVTAGYNNRAIGTADVIRDRGRQFYIGARYDF